MSVRNARLSLVLLVLFLVFPMFVQAAALQPCGIDPVSRLGLVSTFGDEAALTAQRMTVESMCALVGRTVRVGKWQGKNVALIISGGSTGNAGDTLQALIDHFNLKKQGSIITGISGAVDPASHIGDVYIPAQWSEYQNGVYARELPDGTYATYSWLPPGFNGAHDGARFFFPVDSTSVNGELDKATLIPWVNVDTDMLAVAQNLQVDLLKCAPDTGACLTHQPVLHVGGKGVSADLFVDNRKFREEVAWGQFGAESLDMESGAFAHDAYMNGIPFIVIRSASDLAGGADDGKDDPNQIAIFGHLAALNAEAVLEAYVKLLPAS